MNIAVPYFINRKSSYLRFWPVAYAAVLLAGACVSHFAILINDAFPLRWQAEHFSLAHPESFYNGFFPIGYLLLLRIAAAISGNPLLSMILFQIAISPLYALLAYRFLHQFVSERAAILAMPFVLFSPQIVRAILSPAPDFLAALAVLAGLVFFMQSKGKASALLAGAGFGVGYILRSHVLAFAAGFVIAILSIERRNLKTLAYFFAGLLPFVIAQGLIQIWSGHGFFENMQAFNIWKTMHGMDWNNPAMLVPHSVFRVIMQGPLLFLKSYLEQLWYTAPFLVPLTVLPIAVKNNLRIKLSLVPISFAAIIYLLIATAGNSSRTVTLVIPVVAASAIYLVEMAAGRLLQRRMVVPIVLRVTIAIALSVLFYRFSGSAKRVEDYSDVGRLLGVKSNGDANRIYSDDFDFYFPNINYSTPRTSGGWPMIGIPNYAGSFPHIRDTSALAEHDDLASDGIRWAVFRIPPYDLRGYQSVISDTSLFILIYRTRLHEIYQVQ